MPRRGFEDCALLTTERAAALAQEVVDGATWWPRSRPDGFPTQRPRCGSGVNDRPLVALGGGRVIDTAKAIAGADGLALRSNPDHAVGRRDDRLPADAGRS